MSSKRRRPSSRTIEPMSQQQPSFAPSVTPPVQVSEQVSATQATSAAQGEAAPQFASVTPPAARGRGASSNVAHEKDRIGDILRRVREHRGEDIEMISDILRIRPSFLTALENSRYNEIPADTYVIGFLRTYASYLGLDGKGAIEQYRREMAGRRRPPQLSMPQPMSEGRIPTAAILVVATLACLIIYGLWYGLSTPDRSVVAQPVFLPDTKAEETKTSSPGSEALAATPAGDLLLQTTTGATAAISNLEETKKDEAAQAADKLNAPAERAKPDTTPPDAAAKPQAPPQPTAAPAPAAQAAPAPEAPAAQAEAVKVKYGSAKARLVIKAEKDSWVMVTDSKGVSLFDKTLKPGETYGVPEGKDLRLTTGNAVGLSMTLDGAALPRMSSGGKVVRGLSLASDKIKDRITALSSGKAVEGVSAAKDEVPTQSTAPASATPAPSPAGADDEESD